MKLKCIGGYADGKYCDVEENARIGFAIRYPETPKFKVLDYIPSLEESRHMSIYQYHIYIVSSFNFSKDDIYKFLIPQGWSNKEAILFQFNK